MADKFRKVAPLNITFADGEQPTAAKLTAVANQTRNGLGLLEYPIGDPWNQNGDDYLVGTPVQIPNLSRLLGQNSYLNPTIYPGKDSFKFYDKVGERYENQTEGYFKFLPSTTVTKEAGSGSAFTTPVSNEYDVDAAGEYWFDADTGRFRTYTVITSADVVSYTVDPSSDWVVGSETLPGVIPDSGQTTFTSCRIKRNSATSYSLYLPPRQPLTLTSRETPSKYPSAAEVILNALDTTVPTSPPSYWQDDSGSTNALFDPHYRYRLPKDILDVIASKSAGSELPAGLLYLWDQNTETIIDGVIFKRSDASTNETPTAGDDSYSYEYIIDMDVTDSTFDFDAIDTSDETEASYSDPYGDGTPGISLITCGSPVARNVWTLLTSFTKHSHRNDGTFEGQVSHNDLTGMNPPIDTYADHTGRYPADLPSWSVSRWSNDPHTSLLSRGGSPTDAARKRDGNKNAMLGNLLIANSDSAQYLDATCDDSSFKIFFGDTTGTSLHVDATNGLTATAAGGANFVGLRALSTGTGHALEAIANDSSKGLYVNNRVGIGTTTPVSRLEVEDGGTAASSVVKITCDDGTTKGLTIGNDTYSTGDSTGLGLHVVNTGESTVFAYGTNSQLRFGSEGSEAMRIDENQNVGIGTTTPSGPLDIHNGTQAGLLYLNQTTPGSYDCNMIFQDNGTDRWTLICDTTSTDDLRFYSHAAAANVLNLQSSTGNVGIGTTSPTNGKLEVVSSSGTGLHSSSADSYGITAESDTSSPDKAALRLVPQDTDPATSPAAGDIYVNSVTGQLLEHNGREWAGILQNVFFLSETVVELGSDGTSERLIDNGSGVVAQYTIPADTLRVGSTIRICVGGLVTNYTSGTVQIKLKIDGTQYSATTHNSGANSYNVIDWTGVVTAIGAATTAIMTHSGTFSINGEMRALSNEDSTNFQTTGSQNIEVYVELGHADSDVYLRNFTIDISG